MDGAVSLPLFHCLVALGTAVSLMLSCGKCKKKSKDVSARAVGAKEPDWKPPPSKCPEMGEFSPPKEIKKEEVVMKPSIKESEKDLVARPDAMPTKEVVVRPDIDDTTPLPEVKTAPGSPMIEIRPSQKETAAAAGGGSKESAKESVKEADTLEMVKTDFGEAQTVGMKKLSFKEKTQKSEEQQENTLEMVKTDFGEAQTVGMKKDTSVVDPSSGRQADVSSAEPVPTIDQLAAQKKKRSARRSDKKNKSFPRRGTKEKKEQKSKRKGGSKREESSQKSEQESNVKGRTERDQKLSRKSDKRTQTGTKIIQDTQMSTKMSTI